MKTNIMTVKFTYTEPCLAVSPGNLNIFADHIAATAEERGISAEKLEEETRALEDMGLAEAVQKQSTIFFKDDQGLFFWDYHIKGHFKEQYKTLIELEVVKGSKWTAARCIDNCLFVEPRRIRIMGEDGKPKMAPDGHLDRTLRVETPRGPRICLARSELINAGSWYTARLEILTGNTKGWAVLTPGIIEECLKFGRKKGNSQWRSGSFGRYTYEILGRE